MDLPHQIGFALQAGLPMLRENNVRKGFFEHGSLGDEVLGTFSPFEHLKPKGTLEEVVHRCITHDRAKKKL